MGTRHIHTESTRRKVIWGLKRHKTVWGLSLGALLVAIWAPIASAETDRAAGGPEKDQRIELTSRDLQGELARADSFYNAHEWDRAIAVYEAILAKAPTLTVCYLRVADAHRSMQNYDRSLATYTRWLKVDPTDANAKVGMAMTNLEKGDMEAAEKWLLKAAESSTSGGVIYYNLGELKLAKGDTEEAAKWYQKAAETDPNWRQPSLKLAFLEQLRQRNQVASRDVAPMR